MRVRGRQAEDAATLRVHSCMHTFARPSSSRRWSFTRRHPSHAHARPRADRRRVPGGAGPLAGHGAGSDAPVADPGRVLRRGRALLALAGLFLTGCTMWIDQFVFFPDRSVGAPAAGIEERWLGGAVSIEVAIRRRCVAVAVVSTFTSLADVARWHYGPLGRLAGERFDSLARMPRVSAPVLVAHGDRDEIVPFELGERLFGAAREPRRFVRVAGADHNDTLGHAELLDAIAEFSREAVARRPAG